MASKHIYIAIVILIIFIFKLHDYNPLIVLTNRYTVTRNQSESAWNHLWEISNFPTIQYFKNKISTKVQQNYFGMYARQDRLKI